MNKYQKSLSYIVDNYMDIHYEGKPMNEDTKHALCLQELVNKETATTPDIEGDGYYKGEVVYDTWICPRCGARYEIDYDDYEYCPKCGQHIDLDSLEQENDDSDKGDN